MTKWLIDLASRIFLLSVCAGFTGQALAGTLVTVNISGTGSGPAASGTSTSVGFTAEFTYDQSQTGSPSGGWYKYPFTSATGSQEIIYKIGTQASVVGAGPNSLPFSIWTMGSLFVLEATAMKNPQVTIYLPTAIPLPPTSLPLCQDNSATPKQYFQTTALTPQSTFTVTYTNGTTFSGTITGVTCSSSPGLTVPVKEPVPEPICYVPVCYPPPAPCSVYVYQPRQACFLPRFFCRAACP